MRATAAKKGPKAIMKATEQLDRELAKICDPLSPAVDAPHEICVKHGGSNHSQEGTSLLEIANGLENSTNPEDAIHPAAKIMAQLSDMKSNLEGAHKAEEAQERKSHKAHSNLVDKLERTMNAKKAKLHEIQQMKRKLAKESKANHVSLEEMNKLSDDLNFGMDHAREGMSKARHNLEQHNAMCEALEENFAGFKRQLGVIVEEINTIRKIIETRMIRAEKVLKKILTDTIV
jgi:chromosome segregation ATPase